VKTHVGRFEIVDDAEELARLAADVLLTAARARPRVGIFLAGGTTPRRTYEVVASLASMQDLAGAHWWFGDERAVPIEHPDSNAGMVLSCWHGLGLEEELGGVRMLSPRFHVMPCARGVDKQVKEISWELHEHAGASARPDLTLLGVGADGHTASLFPGDPALEATGMFASARGGQRITATRRLLAASLRIVFLVAGDAKADAIARITADPGSMPAGQVALEAKAAGCDILWLLDRAACAKIA
jgi:6-phosphogluconolactonase